MLTVEDIKKVSFETSVRGYEVRAVDEFVDEVYNTVKDLNSAITMAQYNEKISKDKVEKLKLEMVNLRKLETIIENKEFTINQLEEELKELRDSNKLVSRALLDIERFKVLIETETKANADQVISEAKNNAAELVNNAKAAAEKMTNDAKNASTQLLIEATQKSDAINKELNESKVAKELEIQELTQKIETLSKQLSDLEETTAVRKEELTNEMTELLNNYETFKTNFNVFFTGISQSFNQILPDYVNTKVIAEHKEEY